MKICITRELWNEIWTQIDLCHKECLKMKEYGDTKGYEISMACSDKEAPFMEMKIVKGIHWPHHVGCTHPHLKVSLVLVGEGNKSIEELRRIYSLRFSPLDRCHSLIERAPYGFRGETAELELSHTSFTYGNHHFDHGGDFNFLPEKYFYDGGRGLCKRTMERIFAIVDSEDDLLKYAPEECVMLHKPETFDEYLDEIENPDEWFV